MLLYTSYFSNYKKVPAEYKCLSIANSMPNSIFMLKWFDVVPPWSIVEAYKKGDSYYDVFVKNYVDFLNKKPMQQYIAYLTQFKEDIVLFCWEKSAKTCHRRILANYLSHYISDVHYAGELTL